MRARGYAAALVGFGIGLVLPATAIRAGDGRGPCTPADEAVLAESRDAVVTTRGRRTRGGNRFRYDRVYGCLRSSTKRTRLDRVSYSETVSGLMRVSGRYVAFIVAGSDPAHGDWYQAMYLANLQTGRHLLVDSTGGLPERTFVTDIVLRRKGVLAYISTDGTHESSYTVYRCLRACARGEGFPERLDRGSTIRPRSLVLRGSRVYWRKRDTVSSQRLP